MCDRARDFLGSAGCQPAVDGSLPATFRRIHGTVENQPRQAAETYRLAACAPQKIARMLQFPGSARVSRVGFGVSPKQSCREVRKGETPLPARETRALPGIIAQQL